MGGRIKNLKGGRFGRLIANCMIDERDNNHVVWSCKCDCGSSLVVRSSSLVSGQTQSCGCYAKEERSKRSRTHGMSKSREAGTWRAMKNRCTKPEHHAYSRYGGRGIKICESWLSSFENFYADMGPRPENTTLDRIDNNKGYYKENCRWSDWNEQQNNRRSTRYLLICGIVMSVSEWGRLSGVPKGTIAKRISSGYSEVCSTFAPVNHRMFRVGELTEADRTKYEKEFSAVAYLTLVMGGHISEHDTKIRTATEQELLGLDKYLKSTLRRIERSK